MERILAYASPLFLRNQAYCLKFQRAPPLLVTLFRFRGFFVCVAYLTVANLARLGISVHWITGGHTIHPPIEGLLPPCFSMFLSIQRF